MNSQGALIKSSSTGELWSKKCSSRPRTSSVEPFTKLKSQTTKSTWRQRLQNQILSAGDETNNNLKMEVLENLHSGAKLRELKLKVEVLLHNKPLTRQHSSNLTIHILP